MPASSIISRKTNFAGRRSRADPITGTVLFWARSQSSWGITQMRLIAMLFLVLSLAGCNGDRIKDSMNVPQVRPQTVLS